MTISRRSPLVLAIGAVIAVGALLALGGLAYLFLRGAPPPPVSLSSASPGATSAAGATTAPPPTSAGTAGPEALEGTWTVDTSIGLFSDFSSSFVGYRVDETFTDQRANTAVGRTPNVEGTLTLSGTRVTAVEITADLTSLESDDDRRDGQLRRQAIQTERFPTSSFELTSPIELGSVPTNGQAMHATAMGELTLHGVTKAVEVPIEARLSGDVVTVTGSTEILFAEYDIEQPTSFLVLSIEDHGTMEFQLHFRRA